jgi:hypothetical protein
MEYESPTLLSQGRLHAITLQIHGYLKSAVLHLATKHTSCTNHNAGHHEIAFQVSQIHKALEFKAIPSA